MAQQYYQTNGVNTYLNPLLNDGQLIHAVNVESFPYGAKTKRSGYVTFLGTPDSAEVNSLWSWTKNSGTETYVYRKSGTLIYYSLQGTGAWTIAGNGTAGGTATHVGNAVLDNTMIIGDGVGSTRHTTNGTAFTNTTLAPVGEFFTQFQNRVYLGGTSSNDFYSVTNDATNWNTSGTSDSNSFVVPGAGKLGAIFKAANQHVATKNSGLMYRWDGFSLRDMATSYGPSSPYSVAQSEDYWFFINQYGLFGFNGDKPQLLSNAVQRQFYNRDETGISGTIINKIPADCHKYDYFAAIGTVTDDFTGKTIPDAILKYDYQKNEFLNWKFANFPTSFHSYRDADNVQQLIFGAANGQVYKLSGTATTDNGNAIYAEMIYVFTYGQPEYEKKWNFWRGFFNPGCQAKVQVAVANTYTRSSLKWKDLGDCTDGLCEYRFPASSMGRLLFVRITESSVDAPFTYYGCSIDAEVEVKR